MLDVGFNEHGPRKNVGSNFVGRKIEYSAVLAGSLVYLVILEHLPLPSIDIRVGSIQLSLIVQTL